MQLYSGISQIASQYDYYILDIWGVMHDGQQLYPGALQCLKQLRQQKKKIIFLSNTSSRAQQVASQLAQFDISAELYDQVISAGEITFQILKNKSEPWAAQLKRNYYYLGPRYNEQLLQGLDYQRVNDAFEADFILLSGLYEEKLSLGYYTEFLISCAQKNLPVICTNPDIKIIRQDGSYQLCAGALAEYYELAGGKVFYIGKPYPAVYEFCLKQWHQPPLAKIAVVGDGLMTDIKGGANFNLTTILVVNGVSFAEILQESTKLDLDFLNRYCKKLGIVPTAAIENFTW